MDIWKGSALEKRRVQAYFEFDGPETEDESATGTLYVNFGNWPTWYAYPDVEYGDFLDFEKSDFDTQWLIDHFGELGMWNPLTWTDTIWNKI